MVNVIKPSFVSHEDDKSRPLSILSAEVSPDGSRLATGGLDQKIKIWNTAPILDENEEKNPETKRLLSTLGAHTGNILCVRWSPDGAYLASGSDDNIVIVWEKDDNAFGRKVFGQAEENHEVWKAVGRLVGHESDVSSLAWSKDGYYLATGGSDTKIMIWETQNFTRTRTIGFHQGFVKGLAFDPVGELLASQADDQSVCIWRTSDWSLIAKIEEPFYNSPNASWFRRLSWSPEGTFLAVPNSINNGVFVAGILKRREWDAATSLVGHDNVIDVTAFNPISFVKDPSRPPVASNLCSVLAVAARSCISVWLTSQVRPIVVFDTIVDRDTLDLSWSSDGTTLYACSSEGHIAIMQFGLAELGHVAPPGTQEQYLATWGVQPRKPLIVVPANSANGRVGTSSAPNMLMARPKKQPRADNALLPIPPQGAPQHITRTKEGKRRIQPTFLGLGGITPRNMLPTSRQSDPSLQPSFQSATGPAHSDQNMRREDVEMMEARMDHLYKQNGPPPQPYRTPLQNMGLPSWAAPQERPLEHAIQASRKRKAEQMDFFEDEEQPHMTVHRPPGRTLGGDRSIAPPYTGEVVEVCPAYIPTTITHVPSEQLQLAVPAVKAFASHKWDRESDEAEVLEIRNFAEASRPAEVSQVNANGKVQWLDYLPGAIVSTCFCPNFSAVCGADNTLNVYSPSGRRLIPTLMLDSPASFTDAAGDYLLIITSRGTLQIWDIRKRNSPFRFRDVTTVFAKMSQSGTVSPIINTAKVRTNGCPIISLSNGLVVAYDPDLNSWMQVTSLWWSKGSEFWEGRVRFNVSASRGVIKVLESEANDFATGQHNQPLPTENSEERDLSSLEGEEQKRLGNEDDWKQAMSLGHLESRMAAAIALDSITEYRVFLSLYAKKLAEEAFRGKAEELIKDLLGPVYFKSGKENTWQTNVLGVPKHQLLKTEVLNIFAKSKAFTKLASDTTDLLKKMAADT